MPGGLRAAFFYHAHAITRLVGRSTRERGRVKLRLGKNLPKINKLLIKRLLSAHLGQ